jgi:hypothetical protein
VCLEDATRADLEDFMADLLARRSAATAATRYKALRVLYRWLEEEECSAKVAASARCRSAARVRPHWTATYVSVTGTSTRICPGCGWGYGAGSPNGAW